MRIVTVLISAMIITVCASGGFASGDTTMKGRIISVEDDMIMVKSGSSERNFIIEDTTKIKFSGIESAAADADKPMSLLEICQTVRVKYVESGSQLTAVSVEILKGNDCIFP